MKRHFEAMKDGAIVCNTGHYDCEINIPDLESLASSKRTIRSAPSLKVKTKLAFSSDRSIRCSIASNSATGRYKK